MKYNRTEFGIEPVCENEEESLWMEAVQADMALLFKQTRKRQNTRGCETCA
jgi:hypothetical protein